MCGVLDTFVDAGRAAKLDIALSPDIERALWEKFILLTAATGIVV
jgi:ketopantoate reductase